MSLRTSRRRFLASAAGMAVAGHAGGEEIPEHSRRSTSGDPVEPNWTHRFVMTVGPQKADLVGSTDKAIQAAIDYVARLGGGLVRILPGEYRMRNAVYLPSRIRLAGSGPDTVLKKAPSRTTTISADSDWYDQEITLKDASGFEVGDGVCLKTKNPHHGGIDVVKRTLVARSGNRFRLDRALRENFWVGQNPTVSTLFPILSGENISEIQIENLALDGLKTENENLDGNHAGCIFLQDCQHVTLRGITAKNYNGDGISWQICHDVVVENCHSHDNAGLGLHPGSGSQRPRIAGCRVERNQIGIFFCWGVKHGFAERNVISGNREAGVSIGHRDTDNSVRENVIVDSGQVGVLFRPERGPAFAPHRNRIEKNTIKNSGPADGVAIDLQGATQGVVISNNLIEETRQPMSRAGVKISVDTGDLFLKNNRISGFALAIQDLRANHRPSS